MEFVKVMRAAMNAKAPECVEAAAYAVLMLSVAVLAVLTVWYIVKLVKAAIEDKRERDRMERQMVMERNRKPYEKPVLEEVKLMNYDQAAAVLGVAHSMVSKLLRRGKLRQLPKKQGERYAPNGGIIAESVYRLAAERQAMLIARAEKALEQVRKQEGRK